MTTPLYPLPNRFAEVARHYLGTDRPLVLPDGTRRETGDDAPVDLWLIEQRSDSIGSWIALTRRTNGVKPPPPYAYRGDQSTKRFDELLRATELGIFGDFSRAYAAIAVRALNAGVMPGWVLPHYASVYGGDVVRRMLMSAGLPLNERAQAAVEGIAGVKRAPTFVLKVIDAFKDDDTMGSRIAP